MEGRPKRYKSKRDQDVLNAAEYAQQILDNIPLGLLTLSADLRVLSANRWFLETFALKKEHVVGRKLDDVMRAQELEEQVMEFLDGGGQTREVVADLAVAGRGEKRPARLTLRRMTPRHNGRVMLVIEEPTESERVGGLAEAHEQPYRELLESLHAIVWEADAKTFQFTFVSQRAEKILGYPVGQWLMEPDFWAHHLHPEDRQQAVELRRRHAAKGEDHEVEYRLAAVGGRVVWVRDIVHVVGDAKGRPLQLRGVMVDITEHKCTEEAMRESGERLQAIFENAAFGIALTDLRGLFVLANRAYQKLVGCTLQKLLERSFMDFIHEDDLEASRNLFMQLVEGRRPQFQIEKRYRRKDGNFTWVRNTVSLIRDTGDRPRFVVAIVEDITESKQLEEQLRQSQKMEAVGRLAGGLAHDFNNLLTAISGYSELLLQHLDPRDPLRRLANGVKKAVDQATSLTTQLLAFSRQRMFQPRVLDLNAVIAGMENMLHRLIGEDIELVTIPTTGLGRIKGDPALIEEVILNLAVNARDAMPKGGKLTLETANVDLDSPLSQDGAAVPPGRYVLLAVSDTGIGMDEEIQAHIFEPFFTTKEEGKGTGLGLATVYGIVNQSGGYIAVHSKLGQGTAFRIYFPRVEQPAEKIETPRAPAHPDRGTETILLVEDEALVREVASTVLQERGYKVLEAAHGEEALSILKRYRGTIHMLLTDVVMPRMSGHELAAHVTSVHPEMRVLYISGYTNKAIPPSGLIGKGSDFFQKPFTPDALARKVRMLLDASGATGRN